LFLICSDGFRNQITETELKEQMADAMMCTSTVFERIPVDMVNRIKERGEKDNISAIFVKYTQEK
jgi:serine/threonine protein phosphatase PrpC